MELPKFKYYPEPLVTGSIEESDCVCECCGKNTGFIYTGLPYSEEDLEDSICPWCIANGEAHKKSMLNLQIMMLLVIMVHGQKFHQRSKKKLLFAHRALAVGKNTSGGLIVTTRLLLSD